MEQTLKDMEDFGRLGELTGGGMFIYNHINLDVMRQILDIAGAAAAAEYVAGFAPAASPAGPRQHQLEVKLVSRKTGKLVGGKRSVVY